MNIASYIDHTLLKADAQKSQIIKLCEEAKKYNFASVCVNPYYAPLAKKYLKGSNVKVCVVIGFPLGATFTEVKVVETRMAIENGAEEVDMVVNIGALKDGDYRQVQKDIEGVVNAAEGKAIVKVIIETCLLSNEQKKKACELAVEAGANFVKTSTGFSTKGATKEDVKLMKKAVKGRAKVKASGGIRDYNTAINMIEAGADRIGASSSITIVEHSS